MCIFLTILQRMFVTMLPFYITLICSFNETTRRKIRANKWQQKNVRVSHSQFAFYSTCVVVFLRNCFWNLLHILIVTRPKVVRSSNFLHRLLRQQQYFFFVVVRFFSVWGFSSLFQYVQCIQKKNRLKDKSRETQSTIRMTAADVNALKEARQETSILYVMDSLFTQIPFAFFVHRKKKSDERTVLNWYETRGMFYVNLVTEDFLSIFQVM